MTGSAVAPRSSIVIQAHSEHPFFLPAQKLHLLGGFQEKRRLGGEPDPRYQDIEYERTLQHYLIK